MLRTEGIIDRPQIPEDLVRFVLLAIPSVPYLEAVLLLRSNPNCHWGAPQVAQRLYLAENVARDLLIELREAGVIRESQEQPGNYLYAPRDDHLAGMVDRLATEYARNLVGITNLIHSRTARKAHQFADAFLLRRDR